MALSVTWENGIWVRMTLEMIQSFLSFSVSLFPHTQFCTYVRSSPSFTLCSMFISFVLSFFIYSTSFFSLFTLFLSFSLYAPCLFNPAFPLSSSLSLSLSLYLSIYLSNGSTFCFSFSILLLVGRNSFILKQMLLSFSFDHCSFFSSFPLKHFSYSFFAF